MPIAPIGSRLAEPVSLRSRIVPCAGAIYTEVAGLAVVWEPSLGALHELSPAAAALWARLDGRPLGRIVAAAAAAAAATPAELAALERDTVEVVRRLRALNLVEDRDPTRPTAPGDAAGAVAAPPRVVVLAGRPVPDGDGEVTVVLASHDVPAGEAVPHLVEVDVTRPAVVGHTTADGTGPGPRGVLAGFVGPDQAAGPVDRSPVALLGALMDASPARVGGQPLVLDALAELVERVGLTPPGGRRHR